MKMDWTPDDSRLVIRLAERYLRDLKLELPDVDDAESKAEDRYRRLFAREQEVTSLIRRLSNGNGHKP